jgi:hypothetical protein
VVREVFQMAPLARTQSERLRRLALATGLVSSETFARAVQQFGNQGLVNIVARPC